MRRWRSFCRSILELTPRFLPTSLYEYRDKEAVNHLFRMASAEPGLDGRGRAADSRTGERGLRRGARRRHCLGPTGASAASAFAAAKKARSETGIGSNAVSIASVAVDLARKIFGSLEGRTVFLVGAGKMSELAARHLVQQGAGAILVSNRTAERARRMIVPGAVVPQVISCRCVTCSFAPPGLGGILLEFLTHGLRHGLRSFARFAGCEAGSVSKRLEGEMPVSRAANRGWYRSASGERCRLIEIILDFRLDTC